MWGIFCEDESNAIVNCDFCGCCLNDLDENLVVGTTCRDCYELFEADFDRTESEVEQ